jgi:hypothetical protein
MYQYTIYTRGGGATIISHRAPNTLEPALPKLAHMMLLRSVWNLMDVINFCCGTGNGHDLYQNSEVG